MSKMQPNFENNEVEFQLELNLQLIRRELVRLLDESEQTECFTCSKLKCTCPRSLKLNSPFTNYSSSLTITPITSPITSVINGDRNLTDDKINKSHEEIKAWIKSCSAVIEATKTGKEVTNITWPPAISSIWNDTKIDFAKLLNPKPNFQKPANVEAFFKNVGDVKLTQENITGVLKYLQKHHNNAAATAMMQYLSNATKTSRSITADNYSCFF